MLHRTVFSRDDEARRVTAVDSPPQYVHLARVGNLPSAIDELRRLFDGREMRHLVVIELD
jgi:hypothetical protein